MKNKHVIYDYNETTQGIEQLCNAIRWLGGHVEDIAKDSGATFNHWVISKDKLTEKQVKGLKKRNNY